MSNNPMTGFMLACSCAYAFFKCHMMEDVTDSNDRYYNDRQSHRLYPGKLPGIASTLCTLSSSNFGYRSPGYVASIKCLLWYRPPILSFCVHHLCDSKSAIAHQDTPLYSFSFSRYPSSAQILSLAC